MRDIYRGESAKEVARARYNERVRGGSKSFVEAQINLCNVKISSAVCR